MMYRFKLTFSMGICFLFFCLAGDANQSVAKDKPEEPKLITCVCNQVPLGPAGENLLVWMAYRYQYESDCSAATAVSVIEFDEAGIYPEILCGGPGPCGGCATRLKNDQKKKTTEPVISHYMHPLPAPKDARPDLFPPQSDMKYEIIRTRYIIFGDSNAHIEKYAKVFLLCVSKSENPTEQPDALYFWYGFEVDGNNEMNPIRLPSDSFKKRADYYMNDGAGGWSQGTCREFTFINYGGMQFLIRFKDEGDPGEGGSDRKGQKETK
ncbi:hypothetical protein [Gimesia maris]|uniref:hypothetical protein n=1 Tax=Gimesia maris TaxID=122 RepID=UPI0030DB57EF|tara:strand:- start:18164 stop:18961 length:798 start_codon:yes stop_codon:yes gene_type:complete